MHPVSSIITLASSSGPGVFPFSPATGTGTWAGVEAWDDGDQRDAQNINTLPLGDRANLDFVAWRCVNWVDGGNYAAWTSSVTFGNIFHFDGDVRIETPATFYILSTSTAHQVCNGAVFNIGSPGILGTGTLAITGNGFVFFDSGSTTTASNGSTFVFATGSVVTFNNEPTFSAGALFEGQILHSGTAAFENWRINTGPNATQNITGSNLDSWVIPALSADRTWTLNDPVIGVNMGTRFRIRQNSVPITQLHNLTIKDSTGLTLAVFAPGAPSERSACIEFEEDSVGGNIWAVVSKYDPDGHVSVA